MLVLHGGEGLQGWQQVAVVLQVLQGEGGWVAQLACCRCRYSMSWCLGWSCMGRGSSPRGA